MNNRMRNIDRLLHLPLRELAPYFVKDKTIEHGNLCFLSPSGNRFWIEEDAFKDCIEWLESEVITEDT